MQHVIQIIYSEQSNVVDYIASKEYAMFLFHTGFNHSTNTLYADWDYIFKTLCTLPSLGYDWTNRRLEFLTVNSYNRFAVKKGNNGHCLYLLSILMENAVGIYPDFNDNITEGWIFGLLDMYLPSFCIHPKYFISHIDNFWNICKWPFTLAPFSGLLNKIKNRTHKFSVHKLSKRLLHYFLLLFYFIFLFQCL